MQPESGPTLLLTHRDTGKLLERSRVRVEDDRVVYDTAAHGMTQTFNLPYANIACLFLGQGSSISTDAMRRLAQESVIVVASGTGGQPIFYGSLEAYRPNDMARRAFRISETPAASLRAAIRIMELRCGALIDLAPSVAESLDASISERKLEKLVGKHLDRFRTCTSLDVLLGVEGNFSKSVYALFRDMANAPKFRRKAGAKGRDKSSNDDVEQAQIAHINSRIDHGNYIAYGIAGSALWACGVPPAFTLLHGKTRKGGLVFDLADSFKDAVVLPWAFCYSGEDQGARERLMQIVADTRLLERAFRNLSSILDAGDPASTQARPDTSEASHSELAHGPGHAISDEVF